MNVWNLITLDATKILHNPTERELKQQDGNYEIDFRYDLSDKTAGRNVISSEDTFIDNALFFQLEKVLLNGTDSRDTKNFLRSSIVFVDFKEVFAKTDLKITDLADKTPSKAVLLTDDGLIYRLAQLFRNGLSLSFDGKNFKHFVPFDKSSSMARSSQITFIDSEVKTALDKRLMLDMNFLGARLELSKFYAYRGLYLSAAFRLELDPQENFALNEESVVVLPDYENVVNQTVFSASKDTNASIWKFGTKEKTLALKSFDGEGLIAPDLAKYFSDTLQKVHGFKGASHSFQIRLPFTKGVLHEVDFNGFFCEYAALENGRLLVRDIFGITRDLSRAKMILTKSMFKCAGWIIDSKIFAPDPMKIFFEKFAKYDHAIYVTNTEARLSNPGKIKLNYQFLSTAALTDENFNSLVDDHRKNLDALKDNFATSVADDETENTGDESLSLKKSFARSSCLKAARKNPAFLRDPKVKNIFGDMLKNAECDLGLGRLTVEGEQRFLSGDLLRLLTEILAHAQNVQLDEQTEKFLKGQCLYPDRFFMAENVLPIKADALYVFLRNPHLSRNEQVLLKAYVKRNSPYRKYFSHLKGTVMISARSTVAMALGGADFDGDLVKISADTRLVQAVRTGKDEATFPPVEIPAAKPKRLPLGQTIPLQVIVDTFANKVGLVSDYAAKLSEKEYFDAHDEIYKDACAKCTLVVGLEIDAAKTGIHPDANIEELERLANGCGKNIFLTAKKILERILQGRYSPVAVREKDALILYLSAEAKKRGLSSLTVPLDQKSGSVLSRLPERYLKFLADRTTPDEISQAEAPSQFFSFEVDGWRKNLDEEKRRQLDELIRAYLNVLSLEKVASRLRKIAAETKFNGHVLNLLNLQYDDFSQKLPCGMEVGVALNQLYAELAVALKTPENVKKALNSLKVHKWHLVAQDDRPNVAAEIIGLDKKTPEAFDLLYNFRCNGFMLFYFALKELHSRLLEESDVTTELSAAVEQSSVYKEMYDVYSTSVAAKKSKQIWNRELVKICRRRLCEIFGKDMTDALKHFWSKRSLDPGRNFLWNVFSEQEILSQIHRPPADA